MTAVDRVLLEEEWGLQDVCPTCQGLRPVHEVGCIKDQALAERGWTTQEHRDQVRANFAAADTEPPPPER